MATERVPFYTVDAFTDTPFDGNPAAVCLDIDQLPESAMMAIAREMNLSETAFIYEPDDDGLRRL
ncbi:MAG: PhzF family phenazine biosynthesis protein, partial [Gemmatimonadota bacterium]|nr:PhzF family phenazine biosynthesis protein [Gemmatimonadota bacterium]